MSKNFYNDRLIKTIDDVLRFYPNLKTLPLPLEFQLNDDTKCLIDKDANIWKIKIENGILTKEPV